MTLTEAQTELARATAARQQAEEHLTAIGDARRRIVAADTAEAQRAEDIHQRIRAAILAGGEPSTKNLEQFATSREAKGLFERLRKELVVDELAARLEITTAAVEEAEAEAIQAAAELEAYRRKQAECLSELAVLEGGRLEAQIDGQYSRALRKRVDDAQARSSSLRLSAGRQNDELTAARGQLEAWIRSRR